MKRITLVLVLMVLLMQSAWALNETIQTEKVVVYFFWGDGCPHCAHQKPFMENLTQKYPQLEIKAYEVWNNPENAKLFEEMAKAYGIRASGVPMTFIGGFEPTIGYGSEQTTGVELEEKIDYCIEYGCVDPADKVNGESGGAGATEPGGTKTCVHVFVHGGCSQCQKIIPYLKSLEQQQNIKLSIHDVANEEEKTLYESFKRLYGLEYAAYPVVFIGNSYLIGESTIKSSLESELESCASKACLCPVGRIRGMTPSLPKLGDSTGESEKKLIIPLVGEVDLESMPLFTVTLIIAFLDGINPCSLWVITFLLAIVVHSGSRKKIVIVGLTFLAVATLAYGLFIVGILNVFLYMGYMSWIRVGVALVALMFAAVNIKDYFWYKKGLSFTISDEQKPGIFEKVRNIRKLMDSDSILPLVAATAAMSLGVTLVELPCTIGLPVMWTNIIAAKNVDTMFFLILLAVYLFIYALDELIVFTSVVLTLKASKMQEKHGRALKLLGGVIMLTLALVMLFKPALMDDVTSSTIVFTAAIALTAVILYVHRRILPRYGITLGSEELGAGKGETKSGKGG